MPKPTRSVKKMLTMPDGVLSSAEMGPEKPNPAIRVEEYVVTTPLDTEIYAILVNGTAGDG
jgi:hypothetical protein